MARYCPHCHKEITRRPPAPCLGCGKPTAAGRGQPRKFCSAACRRQFELASQRFVAAAVASGKMKLADLHRYRKPTRHRAPNKPRQSVGSPPAATSEPRTIHHSQGAS
jgi:hypothetical protein